MLPTRSHWAPSPSPWESTLPPSTLCLHPNPPPLLPFSCSFSCSFSFSSQFCLTIPFPALPGYFCETVLGHYLLHHFLNSEPTTKHWKGISSGPGCFLLFLWLLLSWLGVALLHFFLFLEEKFSLTVAHNKRITVIINQVWCAFCAFREWRQA